MNWESKININQVMEIRSRTLCYLGVGALQKVNDICDWLKNQGIDKVLICTDKTVYKVTGVWDVLEPAMKKRGIAWTMYDEVVPNPTVDGIDKAVKMGKEIGAGAVFGIGGGSPIDTCKSSAVLLHPDNAQYNARDLYTFKFTAENAVPIIAINTTHGTGTEVDRFAVASIPEMEYKPCLVGDCIYPTFAIDDPAVLIGLPANQTRYTGIDALNHVNEACTSLVTNPYVVLLAEETARLVARYLPQAVAHPDDLTARYYLLYASMIAGIDFDNGLLHFTHAMEHPLSAVKPDLAHGLGLAILLPAVIKYTYPAVPEILSAVYAPIVPGLKGVSGEAEECAVGVEQWLFSVGVTEKLEDMGYKESDVDKLVNLAFNTPSLDILLGVAPIKADEKVVRAIYEESMKPMA
ncbi:MAG: iron-containing alcohol dehydrogenase [Syntrophaceticus sp.]|jgi:alcohol dehydrogenase class IV|nr:iron-containing alcohol dehydrogenase [Syntrophaceticus sp.]